MGNVRVSILFTHKMPKIAFQHDFVNIAIFILDVFWYRVEEDLIELMNSEQYETSREENRSYLTIYNPIQTDGGQYMAIAINEKGQCCQYLILTIKSRSLLK